MLVFSSGSKMGGASALRLPGYVAPGQAVDVSVTLTAPATKGEFRGYWMLRNPSGILFGYGDQADKAFYVDILVSDLPQGTVTGAICYPSEFIPPMTLSFEVVDTAQVFQFAIPENHTKYSVSLPAGTYYAYAWAPGYNLEGAYVDSEGYLKPFTVRGGRTRGNIDICDWGLGHHTRDH
jgi:hypothetical protein